MRFLWASLVIVTPLTGLTIRQVSINDAQIAGTPRSVNALAGAWETVIYESDRSLPPENPLHPLPRLGAVRASVGLRLFTEHHYTFLGVTTTAARPSLPSTNVTLEQLIAVWAPIAASGGTYELRGDTLVLDASIAKNPRPAGLKERFIIRFVGDSLYLIANGVTEKCVRVDR
jgi:hypothetical protein